MIESHANFSIGQIVGHQLYGYRGVIVDVDPYFKGTDEWYKSLAPNRPEKGQPWYHVLVDGSDKETYVAESSLVLDQLGGPVIHPWLTEHRMDYQDETNQYESLMVFN